MAGRRPLSRVGRAGSARWGLEPRLKRLLDLLHLTSTSEGWTSVRLARRFGVSRRQIFEDVHFLNRAGFRLLHDGRGYRLAGGNPCLPVTLRSEEILALLRPLGRGHREARETAQRKLAAALPAPLRDLFRDPRSVRAEFWATPVIPEVWEAMDRALGEGRVLRIRYRGLRDGAARDRLVEPRALFVRGTGWYLGAWCRSAGGWRLFRMDRVSEAGPVGERFEAREGFDLERYVSSDVGVWVGGWLGAEVEVFPSHVEAVRSEALARGMRFRRTASGGLLEIPRGHLDEAAWWLASFGEGVRVLRPPALRSRLAALGRRIVELNGG